MPRALAPALALAALAAAGRGQPEPAALVPAGAINAVFRYDKIAFVVQDDALVRRQAEAIRERLFPEAELLTDRQAAGRDLAGHNLIVYGTVAKNAWLHRYRDRLPFRYQERGVELERPFRGRHLRVICAIRNPQDPERRAVLYTAARTADLANINAIFHGPTEWVVADGGKVLASGNYRKLAPLSAGDMQRDLDFLVAKIGAVHPATAGGLPEPLRAAIARARTRIGEHPTRGELWLVFNRVLLALHDAHSSLSPDPSGELLDLPFRWLTGGLVCDHEPGDPRHGDLILSIGGHDRTSLLEALRGLVPAENDGWIEHRGEQLLRDPGVLSALGIASGVPVDVEVEHDGQRLVRHVGLAAAAGGRPRGDWVGWRIAGGEKPLGLLTLDACRVDDHYQRTLRAFFEAVHRRRVQRIAVDLRHNGGGDSRVVDEFLRYLDVPHYDSYSGEVRESQDSLAQRPGKRELGYHRYGRTTRQVDHHREPPPFAGKVYALTSPATFSSGNWFAVILQDNGIGEVVGEATGNAPSCYGDILRFTLPASGWTFQLSYKKWVRPDPSRDPADCLTPDHVVALTRQDVQDGTDPVLAFLEVHD